MRACVNMTDSSSLIVTSLRLPFVTFTQVLNRLNSKYYQLRVISQLLLTLVKILNLSQVLEIRVVFSAVVR